VKLILVLQTVTSTLVVPNVCGTHFRMSRLCIKEFKNLIQYQNRYYSSGKDLLSKIPGPKQLPVIGNALLFSPLGSYKVEDLISGFADLHQNYGDVVHLKLNRELVLLFNPNDIQKMYQYEGKYPNRPTFEALIQYRKEKHLCVGIVPDNGREWYRLRQSIIGILHLKTVHSYWLRQKEIAQEFAQTLLSYPLTGVSNDFLRHAFLYSLEAVGVLCYGRRLNCISSRSKEGVQIAEANVEFLEALGKTFHGLPWWKLWKTDSYKRLERSQDFMMKISLKYLSDAQIKMSEEPSAFAEHEPFLFNLLNNSTLTETEINVLLTELFQGGIDATATTITMMLHNIARHPIVQNALYQELAENEPKPGHYSPLLRGCLKETLRIHPTASANSRILNTAGVFSGYHVPKETLVIGVNPVISRNERFFKNPSLFDPWRWFSKKNNTHPYSILPFGHGARMCPGRRFAEQEILLCVSEIIKKYQVISFNEREIRMKLATNLIPADKILLGFVSR